MRSTRALLIACAAIAALGAGAVAVAAPREAPAPAPERHGAPPPRADRPWLPAEGLEATMVGGNTTGSEVRERRPRADGYYHVDTRALIKDLKRLHANTYVYTIWYSDTDWDDLRKEFLPAAQRAGIDVWIDLVPPTECSTDDDPIKDGRCSEPFRLDFEAWAREIATLSKRYDRLKAWAIDDFNFNQGFFTPDYVGKFRQIAEDINPDLGFYLTTYYGAATDEPFMDKYARFLDGVIYPFLDDPNTNTQDASSAPRILDTLLAQTEKRHLGLVMLVYAGRFLDAPLRPTAPYVSQALQTGLRYPREGKLDGVLSYATPLTEQPSPDTATEAGWGSGRLSLTLPQRHGSQAGEHAEASQIVRVDPDAPRYELSFFHRDPYSGPYVAGYHIKRVLIDDRVIWQSDVADRLTDRLWIEGSVLQGPIDVTPLLKGKTRAKLTFQLYEQKGVGDFGVDVGFDHLRSSGFTIEDPDFETGRGWETSSTSGDLKPLVYVYHRDEPERIVDAVSRLFRSHGGRRH